MWSVPTCSYGLTTNRTLIPNAASLCREAAVAAVGKTGAGEGWGRDGGGMGTHFNLMMHLK